MKQIINAKIVTPTGVIENKVLIYDKVILDIRDKKLDNIETYDACGNYLIPGLIDLHIHGYNGADASDGDPLGLKVMAKGIYKNGVTAFLPTTMTISYEQIEKAFDSIRVAKNNQEDDEATILGVHAEGPFINPSKKGAQALEHIRKPDSDFVLKHKDIIKMVTLAPEMDEDFKEIKKIKENSDIVISIGHTGADFNTASASFDAGVTHATHLFNAMTPISHREPGVSGAALFSDKVSCELICDTFHINKALFMPVFKLKGEKFNLITDSLRATGMADGEYELGGQKFVLNGIKCLLPDGTIAGSVLKLNEAVRNVKNEGIPLYEAVNAASLYPAKAINVDKERGSIEIGKIAEFSICDEDINIIKTFR